MPKLEILPETLPLTDSVQCVVLHFRGFIDAPNYDSFVKALESSVGERPVRGSNRWLYS